MQTGGRVVVALVTGSALMGLAWMSPLKAAEPAATPVVLSGVVPDEATKAALLAKARELYGADRVVDQLGVDRLVAPPQWLAHVQRVLTPELKKIRHGQLKVSGNTVELTGEVDSEATHQQLVSLLATQLNNPTYAVRDGLTVGQPGQAALDEVLARRTIEFEPGNAKITPAGVAVLEELLPLLQKMPGRRFEVVGHTDDMGARDANRALSEARAQAVKDYLVGKGVAAGDIVTSGAGPDRPVADNKSPEGRARNRRIEFRVLA